MDSILISKWVNDVQALFQLEKDLDLQFLLEVEKDNSIVLEQLSEYDVQKVARVYKFEAFAMEYRSLAKHFMEVIKPILPGAWLGMKKQVSSVQVQEMRQWMSQSPRMFVEVENAFLDLSGKKVLFDRVVGILREVWEADKRNWRPKGFCENTWMELKNLKIES